MQIVWGNRFVHNLYYVFYLPFSASHLLLSSRVCHYFTRSRPWPKNYWEICFDNPLLTQEEP